MDDPGEPNDTEDNSVGTWSGTLGFPYWLNQQCKKKNRYAYSNTECNIMTFSDNYCTDTALCWGLAAALGAKEIMSPV